MTGLRTSTGAVSKYRPELNVPLTWEIGQWADRTLMCTAQAVGLSRDETRERQDDWVSPPSAARSRKVRSTQLSMTRERLGVGFRAGGCAM